LGEATAKFGLLLLDFQGKRESKGGFRGVNAGAEKRGAVAISIGYAREN